jgi:hypothetical protein
LDSISAWIPKLDVNPVVGNLAGSGTLNALAAADAVDSVVGAAERCAARGPETFQEAGRIRSAKSAGVL